MPVKYRNYVSFIFLLSTIIVSLSSPAHAFNWGNNTNSECHHHASQNTDSRWQRLFHFKQHWFGSHHCTANNNLKPTANAGPNIVINAAESIELNGLQSTDPDGTIASYQWTLINKNWWPFKQRDYGELTNSQLAVASFSAPSSFRTRYFIFRLRVTDDDGAQSSDYVRVKVLPTPKLSIDGGTEFESSEEIELTAKLRRTHPNTNYSWSQLSGPSATFVSANDEQQVSIKLPAVSESETLAFQVAVQYGNSRPMYAVKTITVSEPALPKSNISGRISTVTGAAIANVGITALANNGSSETVITQADSNGEFSLTLDAKTDYVLQLTNASFSTQVIPATSPSTNNSVSLNDIVMLTRGVTHPISSTGEQTIAATDGASVSFDKANFVDTNGQPLVGDMQLTVTPVDVSNTRLIKTFPGLSLGLPESGNTPEMIVALGTVEFHFTHNGEAVNLASGATADVLIPIYVNEYPDGRAIEVGQTAPLRSLNELSGVWIQEGLGIVVRSADSPTGLAFKATVSHFSWWGIDVAIATTAGDTTPNTGVANAIITVNGPPGLGLAVIDATAPGLVNWRGSTVSLAIDIGDSTPSLSIPANRSVCFSAYFFYASGVRGDSNTVCVNEASQATVNVDLDVGVTGAIDVSVTPQVSDDTAVIQGYEGVQSPALRIAATTIETTVTYLLLSGTLPAGLSLDIFDNVLNLVGVPTTAGSSAFVIRATDADGNTDDISVSYDVSSISPPPIITSDTDRFFLGEITTLGGTVQVNLNDMVTNVGGPISQWRELTSTAEETECTNMHISAGIKGPSADLMLPASVTLSKFTGELEFDSPEYWLSCLVAFNNRGTSVFLFGFEIRDTSGMP